MKTSSLSEYAATFIGEPYEWPGFDWCNLYVQAWLEYYGMTEKKTFKNPDLTVFQDGSGWKITPEGVTTYSGSHKWFHANEWDMEVTFTKKEEPLHINHLVQDADRYIGRIVAIQGEKAWVHYTTNQHGGIENFDGIEFVENLKRVG